MSIAGGDNPDLFKLHKENPKSETYLRNILRSTRFVGQDNGFEVSPDLR
jgi:hypothetical protein